MRDIRFRAWNESTGVMVDLQKITPLALDPQMNNQLALKGESGLFLPFCEDLSLMQYTGLQDKNGKGVAEVYEGDIIDSTGNILGNIYESPQVYEAGINHVIEKMGTEAWRKSESIAMGFGFGYAE